MRMPEMDGLALWHRVRERHPNLARRVLFVSGDTLSDQARRSLQETGCPSLDKPFSPDDLLVALGGLLQQHGPGVA
jgi:two-component system NtrC family sensor kinase